MELLNQQIGSYVGQSVARQFGKTLQSLQVIYKQMQGASVRQSTLDELTKMSRRMSSSTHAAPFVHDINVQSFHATGFTFKSNPASSSDHEPLPIRRNSKGKIKRPKQEEPFWVKKEKRR